MAEKLTPADLCKNFADAIREGKLIEAIKWKDKILESSLMVQIEVIDIPKQKLDPIKKKQSEKPDKKKKKKRFLR